MKFIGIIPARYGSSRYRGKPLCDILGKPMILRVYESAMKWNNWYKVYVATDDKRITDFCDKYNIPWIMTDINHSDCIDRCAEASEILKERDEIADRYIIIQGDEPLFNTNSLNIDYNDNVINFYKKIEFNDEINNINIVKVVISTNNYAIYYSRFPIPHYDITTKRTDKKPIYFKQIGIYVFDYDNLQKYRTLDSTNLENFEGIGLNRFIENNIPIKMCYTEYETVSVDVIEDKYKVENILQQI